jgi:hypothetical protein
MPNLTKLSVLLALLCLCSSARALVLDWDTVTWAPGTFTHSYDVDPDPAKPGNDVTVTVGGDTNRLTTDPASGTQTPAITVSLEGGTSPVQAALHIAADLHTNDTITLTINFLPQYALGVQYVSFTIFDIDTETNADEIHNMYALAPDGITKIFPTITLGSGVSSSGSGLGRVLTGIAPSPNTGAGSDTGNATFDFGTNLVGSVTFTFANTPGAPRLQQIALSDISFVPEINPAFSAVAACLAAIGVSLRRRTKKTLR